MTATPPVRAAVYLRISLDANADGLAVQRQREDCMKIIEREKWTLVDTYTDNSRSAYSRTAKRPEYDRMVRDWEAGRFDTIVCYDLDRLTRQPKQLEDWIERSELRGLRLVTATAEADLATDNGRMFARMKATIARSEVERKSARQKRAAVQRKEMGRVPLGSRLYGYTFTKGELIPDQAKVVREAFKLFEADSRLTYVAAQLNEKGYPTRRGGPWTPSTVRTMLTNPRYAGRFSDDRQAGTPQWQAIVEPEQFDTVQAILASSERKKNQGTTERKHLGSGPYECGHAEGTIDLFDPMDGSYTPSDFPKLVCRRKLQSNGKRYWCNQGGHVIRTMRPIDELVLSTIRDRLAQPDAGSLLSGPSDGAVKVLDTEIRTLRDRLARFVNDYEEGLIDGRQLWSAKTRTEAQLDELERERMQLRSSTVAGEVLGSPDPVQAFDRATLETKRAVIDALLFVILLKTPRGRRGFDPESVMVRWRVTTIEGDGVFSYPLPASVGHALAE